MSSVAEMRAMSAQVQQAKAVEALLAEVKVLNGILGRIADYLAGA